MDRVVHDSLLRKLPKTVLRPVLTPVLRPVLRPVDPLNNDAAAAKFPTSLRRNCPARRCFFVQQRYFGWNTGKIDARVAVDKGSRPELTLARTGEPHERRPPPA